MNRDLPSKFLIPSRRLIRTTWVSPGSVTKTGEQRSLSVQFASNQRVSTQPRKALKSTISSTNISFEQ